MTKLEHLKALAEEAVKEDPSIFGDVTGLWIPSRDVLKLISIIEIQREALEFYGDKANWEYEGMYNKNHDLPYKVYGPADLYDAHKKIKHDDLEEQDKTRSFGGKRAREALTAVDGILGE